MYEQVQATIDYHDIVVGNTMAGKQSVPNVKENPFNKALDSTHLITHNNPLTIRKFLRRLRMTEWWMQWTIRYHFGAVQTALIFWPAYVKPYFLPIRRVSFMPQWWYQRIKLTSAFRTSTISSVVAIILSRMSRTCLNSSRWEVEQSMPSSDVGMFGGLMRRRPRRRDFFGCMAGGRPDIRGDES